MTEAALRTEPDTSPRLAEPTFEAAAEHVGVAPPRRSALRWIPIVGAVAAAHAALLADWHFPRLPGDVEPASIMVEVVRAGDGSPVTIAAEVAAPRASDETEVPSRAPDPSADPADAESAADPMPTSPLPDEITPRVADPPPPETRPPAPKADAPPLATPEKPASSTAPDVEARHRPPRHPPRHAAARPSPRDDAPARRRTTSPADEPATDGHGERTTAAARAGAVEGRGDTARASEASYAALVVAELARHKHYPEAARQQRLQGAVRLSFRVDAAGRIAGYTITQSSGHDALDAAARGMMAAARLPPPPGGSFSGRYSAVFSIR